MASSNPVDLLVYFLTTEPASVSLNQLFITMDNCENLQFYCDIDFSVCKQPSLLGLIAIGYNLKVISKALNFITGMSEKPQEEGHSVTAVNVVLMCV